MISVFGQPKESISKVWIADNADGIGEPITNYKKPTIEKNFQFQLKLRAMNSICQNYVCTGNGQK